jgi:hypothetical protein
VASLEVLVENPRGQMPLRHVMSFTEHGGRFELVEERIENERPYSNMATPYFFYRFRNGYPVLKETAGTQVVEALLDHGQEARETAEAVTQSSDKNREPTSNTSCRNPHYRRCTLWKPGIVMRCKNS